MRANVPAHYQHTCHRAPCRHAAIPHAAVPHDRRAPCDPVPPCHMPPHLVQVERAAVLHVQIVKQLSKSSQLRALERGRRRRRQVGLGKRMAVELA